MNLTTNIKNRILKILNFASSDLGVGFGFDVPAREAIQHFEQKGLKPTFSYADMAEGEHRSAFTIAKMMDMDLLQDMQDSIRHALESGHSYQQWADRIIPHLQANGWWGRQAVLDPITGQTVIAELGSARRLQVIFRTNLQSAYAVGRWQKIMQQKDQAPFLLYDAVDDHRTRPQHRAWDNKVLPVDHPFWRTHTPPNGYMCRCSVIQLSQDDLDDMGLQVSESPDVQMVEWRNPRTGQIERIPKGVDAGFGVNLGQARYDMLQRLATEKIAALEDMQMKAAAQQAFDDAPKVVDVPDIPLNDQEMIINQWIPDFQHQALLRSVNRISASGANTAQLTIPEMLAIRYYTQDGYLDLNQALYGKIPLTPLLKDSAALLAQSLRKLPNYQGVVVRRARLDQLPDLSTVKKGSILTLKGFSSATFGKQDIFNDRPVRLTIDSVTGKNIHWISSSGYGSQKPEFEVLFTHPSRFLVINFATLDGMIYLQLSEITND